MEIKGEKVQAKELPSNQNDKVKPYVPPIPFPQRLKTQTKDANFMKFLEMFKKLELNIPVLEAISHMPNYAKFLKELVANKKRLEEYAMVALSEECSAILLNKYPPKLKDPRSFVIPCTFGKLKNVDSLCDLGASINLMPSFIYKRLRIGELTPTTVKL